MRVLKFGGTSLESPERIAAVAGLVEAARNDHPVAVVVSAWAGVTDALSDGARACARRQADSETICDEMEKRHLAAIESLAGDGDRDDLLRFVRDRVGELRELLRGISMVGECSARILDGILGHGERLSAAIVAAALRQRGLQAEACDARGLIVTDDRFGAARVDAGESYRRIRKLLSRPDPVRVVTGFIGTTPGGDSTTLGRGGSDLTAALLGAALQAESVELWTDVDGVMSADPRLVADAFPLESLTYEELMELSHFGAKVVYPPSVHPARAAGIPIVIRNSLNPGFPGTRIGREAEEERHPIRGISSINRVALLRLEGDGMVGVPGIAMRLFGALGRLGINVILIGQASSEHSICFALLPEAVSRAKAEIEAEFTLERRAGLIDDLVVEDDLSVIAAVGNRMRRRPGIAGRLFTVLGDRGINIHAIAQGSSERNISLVVARSDERAALNAIHGAFFAPPGRACRLFVVGTGRVGGALLDQLEAGAARATGEDDPPFTLTGILNRSGMILDRAAGTGRPWREAIGAVGPGRDPSDLDRFVRAVRESPGRRLLVDCTAGDAVPERYPELLRAGVGIVTANKRPLAAGQSAWSGLFAARREGNAPLHFETTVGAGLPVLRTLRDLVRTGDRIVRIEAILSGTIAFLLHRLRREVPFHRAVREAHRLGYTEPDPREDLGGNDAGRKILILAREAGIELEPDDVRVEPLIPADRLKTGSLERFWKKLPELDAGFAERQRRCRNSGRRLCYLARLDGDRAGVGLEEIDGDHPAATATGTENLVAFFTGRYSENPLVVRGPGAGPEVTAAGLFADILAAAEQLCRRWKR